MAQEVDYSRQQNSRILSQCSMHLETERIKKEHAGHEGGQGGRLRQGKEGGQRRNGERGYQKRRGGGREKEERSLPGKRAQRGRKEQKLL